MVFEVHLPTAPRPNASQVGAFGYIAIPDVQSDVLSSFGEDNKAMYIARVGMGFVSSAILKLPFPRKKFLSTLETLPHYLTQYTRALGYFELGICTGALF